MTDHQPFDTPTHETAFNDEPTRRPSMKLCAVPFRLPLAALATAALLAACGGGDATPPGDTVAPTLRISDSVSTASATGPVTFTFTFSEAVSGFDASDIVVSGGTAGTFTMGASNTSATLIVIPVANATGTLGVSVAAGSFTDTAGNASTTAATGSQAFDTTGGTPPVTNLLANGNFENGATGWEGNAVQVRTEGGNSYNFADVATATPGEPYLTNLSYRLNIPAAGVQYRLTFKASSNKDGRRLIAGIGLYVDPYTNTSQEVLLNTTPQTFVLDLTSNFANADSRVLFDMAGDTGHVVIDDVVLETVGGGTPGPVAGPATAAPTPTLPAANVQSIYSDAYTSLNVEEWGPDWGPSSARIVDSPVGGNATKLINMDAGKVFAGISFPASKFDTAPFTHFSVSYWVPSPVLAGQVLNIKLSNHNGPAETSAIQHTETTVTGGSWQTLNIPLASFVAASDPGNLARNAIAQIVITAARADTGQPVSIYFDNMYFYR